MPKMLLGGAMLISQYTGPFPANKLKKRVLCSRNLQHQCDKNSRTAASQLRNQPGQRKEKIREEKARAQGLEPQPTEPESVVLPITPRPKVCQHFSTLPTWAEVRPPERDGRRSIRLGIS